MNTNAQDRRPKVVSFETILDGLEIAAQQDILWPCYAWTIYIPQRTRRILNIFEQTVLKITAIESGDKEKIAAYTCLEEEFVICIQNHLQQIGLLDDHYEISENGKDLLKSLDKELGEPESYVTATIFVDRLSGKLLPYLCLESLTYQKIKPFEENHPLEFFKDLTNRQKKVKAKLLPVARDTYKKPPAPQEIVNIIKNFKKKYKHHTLLSSDHQQSSLPSLPTAEVISISDDPELIYLHCIAFIQKGNTDLLVTDGCGLGFSESFASYLNKQSWAWLTNIKRKGVVESFASNQDNKKAEDQSSHLPEKYPRITAWLQEANECLTKVENTKIDSTHKEKDAVKSIGKATVALYNSIEWTLRFVVSQHFAESWEELFASQSHQNNGKILKQFAEKLGFDVPENLQTLLEVPAGKMKHFGDRKVEMQPLLALAIAAAANNKRHSLCRLAVQNPQSLSLIRELKKYRDMVAHGSSVKDKLSLETLKGYDKSSRLLIQTLIPDIKFKAIQNRQQDSIEQSRLKAQAALEKSLGYNFFYYAPESLKEELMNLETLMQTPHLNDAQQQECINLLASSMQLLFFDLTKNALTACENSKHLKDKVLKKIVECHFYKDTERIPKEISTVNEHQLSSAVQVISATLGTQFLALFHSYEKEQLIQLQEKDAKIIDFVANLIRLRGHGNLQQVSLLQDNINSLKDDVLKKIKIIREVFS